MGTELFWVDDRRHARDRSNRSGLAVMGATPLVTADQANVTIVTAGIMSQLLRERFQRPFLVTYNSVLSVYTNCSLQDNWNWQKSTKYARLNSLGCVPTVDIPKVSMRLFYSSSDVRTCDATASDTDSSDAKNEDWRHALSEFRSVALCFLKASCCAGYTATDSAEFKFWFAVPIEFPLPIFNCWEILF